jgi:hypothetical protein
MPKTPSVLLREELAQRNIELLDIYSFKDRDIIRARDKLTGRIIMYVSKRKVSTLTSKDEIVKLVEEMLRSK